MDIFVSVIMTIVRYIFENIGLFVGVIETICAAITQILKLFAGIANITTATRSDDDLVNAVENIWEKKIDPIFQWVKKFLYTIGQK
jgi:hypothetical protein